jgi:murein L,D-transpeptidase YcbB/YkuD
MKPNTSTPLWFRRTLRYGDAGPDVEIVRRKLGLDPRGRYDDICMELVRGLARKRQVNSDGEVNESVAGELGETSVSGLTPEWYTRELQLWFEGDDVRTARALLGVPGMRGENRYDPDAEAAVRRFQSKHGLRLTGLLDETTARYLGEAPTSDE